MLHNFGSLSNDGSYPFGGLVRDAAGNLYGTNWSGGGSLNCSPYSGCGTVFKVDGSGNENILHAFTGGADGAGPVASLTRDGAGNLYGTTSAGGISSHYAGGAGTVFKITAAGEYSILHKFGGNPADGGSAVQIPRFIQDKASPRTLPVTDTYDYDAFGNLPH